MDVPEPKQAPGLYKIRPRRNTDDPLIYGTWLQGYYEKGLWPKGMEWLAFRAAHRLVVDRLLARGTTLVACAPDFEDQIFGYVCFEAGVLHWIFVKGPFKRNGIGNSLMAAAGFTRTGPFTFSHLSNSDLAHGLRKKWQLGKYDPYKAFICPET